MQAIEKYFSFFGRPGTLSAKSFLTKRISLQSLSRTSRKQNRSQKHDCGFLIPSQPVTGICANFAKTSSYGKEQHT